MFSLAFSFAIRTEGWSMSVPTATFDPVLAAAMASTPVPQPTSSTRSNRSLFNSSSKAIRHPTVVPW